MTDYTLTTTERYRLRWAVDQQIEDARQRLVRHTIKGRDDEAAATREFIKDQEALLNRLYASRSVTIKEDS